MSNREILNMDTKCIECLNATQAGKNGHLKCLERIVSLPDFTWNSRSHRGACIQAARYGHLECLQYAHIKGCSLELDATFQLENLEVEANALNIAILGGHLECVRYARKNGCYLDNNAYIIAVIMGKNNIIKYIHNQGISWPDEFVAMCARYGNVDGLKYAVEHGAPYLKSTFDVKINDRGRIIGNFSPDEIAAVYGHIDVLRYLCEKEYPKGEETADNAILHGNIDCVKFLIENNYPYSQINNKWWTEDRLTSKLLDDSWWRNFLLNQANLNNSPIIQEVVSQKKLEIDTQIRDSLILAFEANVPLDVIKYVLHSYI